MKKIFKYIIVDTGPIFFGEATTHSQVAEGFPKVYSAGYVKVEWGCVNVNKVTCYGSAASLPEIKMEKLKDEGVIKDYFDVLSMVKYGLLLIKNIYK